MRKITIAIDGHSSTGKSTIAKQLAKALGYVYVDTGAMYRAVTLFALENGFVGGGNDNLLALIKTLPYIKIHFEFNAERGAADVFLNGRNVENEIRSMQVSNHVSKVAAVPEVRQMLVYQQQQLGKGKGVVMDGRDIGTVVFPDAELKLFMTAPAEVRAQRRYKELLEKGEKVSYQEVLDNVINRDYIDSHREASPLQKAPDAIEFDNSDMGIEEQFERLKSLALRVIKA